MSFGISISTATIDINLEAIHGKGWNVSGTATAPPNPARASYLAQHPEAMTNDEAEYLGTRKSGGGARPFPVALVAIGVAAVAGVGTLMFVGRRKNPRASRWTPVLAVGGAVAGLWWLGRRAVAQVREVIPAPAEPPPLEGAFD